MNAETTRAFLLALPHVVETVSTQSRWGNKLVFRVGEQSAGGKMFSQIDFEEDGRAILSLASHPERFHELIERDGIIPARYRAHLHWIALERWNALPDSELRKLLREAVALTLAKLPTKVRASITGDAKFA